jgi:multidrug resistance protein, MATE family
MEEVLLLKEREVLKPETPTWSVIAEELKKLCYLAGPMVAVTSSQLLLPVISVMMVGHLGELSLASTSMANSLCSVTGFSLLVSSFFDSSFISSFMLFGMQS